MYISEEKLQQLLLHALPDSLPSYTLVFVCQRQCRSLKTDIFRVLYIVPPDDYISFEVIVSEDSQHRNDNDVLYYYKAFDSLFTS